MAEDNVKAQMRKGILEYCILAILSREASYAPKIISELKAAEMIVVEGTLYPILTRQKNAGLLTYRWEESPQAAPQILLAHRKGAPVSPLARRGVGRTGRTDSGHPPRPAGHGQTEYRNPGSRRTGSRNIRRTGLRSGPRI